MKKWHLWLAASIGLVVIAGMMIREFDVAALHQLSLSPLFFLGVGIAVLLFAVQNLMLTLRFYHLVRHKLTLGQSFLYTIVGNNRGKEVSYFIIALHQNVFVVEPDSLLEVELGTSLRAT